ncbi:MAG: mechanosensitive ion channel [Ruminiclostridium sp.]|nr:mechanosensitive ion channel [Ruminiclostridium sp.]
MTLSFLLAAETTAAETTAAETTEVMEDIKEVISETFGEGLAEDVGGLQKLVTDVWDGFVSKFPTIIFAIIILVLGFFISKITLKFMGKALDKSKLDLTINHFVKSVVKIVLYVLLITIILTLLGVPTTSIIAVIGTAGVAISLSLQNSLSNLAGGFLILISKPFRVGDYISVSGVEGKVETINILYTKLRTLDNKAVFVPNGIASNAVLVNVTEADIRRVDRIFSISYDEDFRRAVEAIERALAKCGKIITDSVHKPFIRMCAHSASSIDIEVRVWCETPNYWDVYYDMIELVRLQFVEENIEIPYQQIDVHMKNA